MIDLDENAKGTWGYWTILRSHEFSTLPLALRTPAPETPTVDAEYAVYIAYAKWSIELAASLQAELIGVPRIARIEEPGDWSGVSQRSPAPTSRPPPSTCSG
jgi:hypothetical protein